MVVVGLAEGAVLEVAVGWVLVPPPDPPAVPDVVPLLEPSLPDELVEVPDWLDDDVAG